jgi:sugar lactone lactonase YvrE
MQDEIVALDAQTLQPRHRFGQTMLNDAGGMAVVGEELFVCDQKNDRLQVFSLAGEHRRSITGEWKRPKALCFVKDRLYLIEEQDYDDEEGKFINPLQGRRIFVLSLQGDTLQVYTHPDEGQIFDDLCCFDGKLLAPVLDRGDDVFVGVVGLFGV